MRKIWKTNERQQENGRHLESLLKDYDAFSEGTVERQREYILRTEPTLAQKKIEVSDVII